MALVYSFFDGSYDKKAMTSLLKDTDKPILFRYGLSYRGAKAKPCTKEYALERLEAGGFIDVIVRDDQIEVNEFSSNDMW